MKEESRKKKKERGKKNPKKKITNQRKPNFQNTHNFFRKNGLLEKINVGTEKTLRVLLLSLA